MNKKAKNSTISHTHTHCTHTHTHTRTRTHTRTVSHFHTPTPAPTPTPTPTPTPIMEATPGHEQPQSRGAKQSSYPPFITYWKIPPRAPFFSVRCSLDLSFLASSKNSRTIKQIHKSRSTLMDWSRSIFLHPREFALDATECYSSRC